MTVKRKKKGPQVQLSTQHLLCPASGFLHGPLAVPIGFTVNRGKPQITCACRTNAWVSPQLDTEFHGYTVEQIAATPNLTTVQRTTKSWHPPENREPDERGLRYMLCPMGTPIEQLQPKGGTDPVFGVHPPTAVPIEYSKNKNKPTAFCPLCRMRAWLGKRWTPDMGFTSQEAWDQGYGIVG